MVREEKTSLAQYKNNRIQWKVRVKVSQTESGLQNAFGIDALLDVDLPLSDVCWRNIKITPDLITSKKSFVLPSKTTKTFKHINMSSSVFFCVCVCPYMSLGLHPHGKDNTEGKRLRALSRSHM